MADQDDPTNDPRRDDEPDPTPQNPFAGTPMEGLFAALGGSGGQAPDLGALFGQMQQMFRPHDGPVDFGVYQVVRTQGALRRARV